MKKLMFLVALVALVVLVAPATADAQVADSLREQIRIREIVLDLPADRPSTFRAGDFMQITAPPFQLDEYTAVGEDVRLHYRYMDLRRPEMQERLILRSKITNFFRA